MSLESPMDQFESYVRRAAALLALSEQQTAALLTSDRVLEATLAVSLSGTPTTIRAYRVQFSNDRGPYKGGVRFHPDADLSEVKALAGMMAIKTAVVNIPLGGAKGSAQFDPKVHSAADVEAVARAWVHAMHASLGVDRDIPAPDVYTTPYLMGVMLDAYEKEVGRSEPGMITGKPLSLGGSVGRDTATAQGGLFVLLEYFRTIGKTPRGATAVVQGFGNVGAHMAQLLVSSGFRVVGVSDSKGGLYSKRGLDIEHLMRIKGERRAVNELYCEGSVCDMKRLTHDGVSVVSNEELLTMPCDVLVPAALDRQIHATNVGDIKASVILELANGPTTAEADASLCARGVTVIPDTLANAGGVTVSYFEWVQNRQQWYWSHGEVHDRLAAKMSDAFRDMWTYSKHHNISLRDAAYCLALSRILEAKRARGRLA